MITFEQVEKLREKVNVSFEDAKAALEITDGDLLDAVIYLEKSGKIESPRMSAYNTQTGGVHGGYHETHTPYGPYWRKRHGGADWDHEDYERKKSKFREGVRALWGKFCALVRKGNANSFVVSKDGQDTLSVPVTVLVLSALCFFWVTLPLLIIGLFCGCKYQFRGPDFKKETINNVMDKAAETAETIKRSVMSEAEKARSEADGGSDNDLGDDNTHDEE